MSKAEKPTSKKIREDLMAQLERNGTTGAFYTDLVRDYMTMQKTKDLLARDIKERGVVVEHETASGRTTQKKNESVEQMNKVNAQMLKILEALGIRPDRSIADADETL